MSQHYTDENRASDKWSLPDVETFYHQHAKRERCALNAGDKARLYGECIVDADGDCCGTGWYYWHCLPGCMPDSDPIGPYPTEADALKAAREDAGFCEHGISDAEHCEVCD